MTAIDRTAYPRPGARLTRDELGARYSLSDTDFAFIRASARGDSGRMLLATLLKTRQDLGYFATPDEIHPDTASYLQSQMDLGIPPVSPDEERRTKTLYRYQAAVRTHLSVTTYAEAGERLISSTTLESAQSMSDPADLINRAIEALHAAAIDLPAFSTLDRLVNRLRAEVHGRIFNLVAARLTAEHMSVLETLLTKPPHSTTTSFNRLKQAPGPATPKTIKLWIDRLDWLDGALDPDPLLEGIAHTKLRQFAAEAAALEVNDLLDISHPGKRHTLMLALLRQARMRGRDELIEMMLRRIRRTQAAAKERLEALHDEHRGIEEALIGIFGKVLETAQDQENDAAFGCQVRKLLAERGGIETLTEQCDTVSALHRDNELPLLWPIHVRYRNLLFRLLDLMDIQSATQDRSLLDALAVVSKHRHARRNELAEVVDIGFASQKWQSYVGKRRSGSGVIERRTLEVCVFVHLAEALQTGDLYVVGAEDFADYRAQLLSWSECEKRLPAYCAALGISARGEEFASALKDELTKAAAEVDAGFADNSELSIDADGTPHLKQLATVGQPDGLAEFEQEIRARMPERHLLDILKHAEHWAHYTRHFGPPLSRITLFDGAESTAFDGLPTSASRLL